MNCENLSLGCHNLTGASSYARSERMVRCALDLGIRRFDVAPSYGLGTAERTLASALGRQRTDPTLEITTKFGIAPPRFGALAAWLREPYRTLRSARALNMSASTEAKPPRIPLLLSPTSTNTDARSAAIRSLKRLRVDRLGALLVHELASESTAGQLHDDISDLLYRGLIVKAGCSGAVENVRYMLARAGNVATIAQTSVVDWHRLPASTEHRYFNIGALGKQLQSRKSQLPAAILALRDAAAGKFEGNEQGAFIAGAFAWVRHRHPNAILILSASTPERLSAVVESGYLGQFVSWANVFSDDLHDVVDPDRAP